MNQSSPHEHPPLSAADLELLNAALDGELTAEQLTQLQARLADEPELAQESDELQFIRSGLRELPMVTPPRSFTLASAPPRRTDWWRFDRLIWLRTLVPAAAVMVVALLWPLFRPAPPDALVSLDATATPIVAAAAAPAAESEAAAGMMLMAAPEGAPESAAAAGGMAYGTERQSVELNEASGMPTGDAVPCDAEASAGTMNAGVAAAAPDQAAAAPAMRIIDDGDVQPVRCPPPIDPAAEAAGASSLMVAASPPPTDEVSGFNPAMIVVIAVVLAALISGVVVWTRGRRR